MYPKYFLCLIWKRFVYKLWYYLPSVIFIVANYSELLMFLFKYIQINIQSNTKVAYRWLMIIDSPVLSNTCYWSLMVSWSMWGRWSRRRPSSRDKKSVWAPQIEAVRTRRTVDMFKGTRTQIPLVIKLYCNNCHTLFIRKVRCAAQTSSTSCGSPSFSTKVFQISCFCYQWWWWFVSQFALFLSETHNIIETFTSCLFCSFIRKVHFIRKVF